MKLYSSNHRGFALVYSLVVLLLASVGGTALLYMTQRGHTEASDYAKMRSSSLAAVAALKACEGQFSNDPNTALDLLKEYLQNTNNQWLLGTAPTDKPQKQKFWNGTDAPEYAARIVGYDNTNQYVVIEGIGYGSYGGRKRVVASYKLGGLEMVTPSRPAYALFIGGNLENLNCPLNINGDVYISLSGNTNQQHINGGSGGTITGNLKVNNSATNILDLSGAFTVTENALILGKIWPKAKLTVNGKAGFTNGFPTFTAAMYLNNNAFFLQTSDFGFSNCVVGQSSKTVKYNSSISSNRFKDFGNKETTTMTVDDLAAELGMTSGADGAYTVNAPWATSLIKDISNVAQANSSTVESWWTAQKNAGKLYKNEWLIVRLQSGLSMTGGGPFTKKVIWLTNNCVITVNGNWYDCADGSNTMIYVTGANSNLSGMGLPANKKFRGFIYVNSTNSSTTYQFGTNSTFYGAIQHKQGKFDINSGLLKLVCNSGSLGQTAVQELVDIGVLSAPTDGTTPTPVLTLVDIKIRPTLLSMQL